MLRTLWATMQDGRIQLSEQADLPEEAKVLVTILPEDEDKLWREASQKSLAEIWDDAEDQVYAALLEK